MNIKQIIKEEINSDWDWVKDVEEPYIPKIDLSSELIALTNVSTIRKGEVFKIVDNGYDSHNMWYKVIFVKDNESVTYNKGEIDNAIDNGDITPNKGVKVIREEIDKELQWIVDVDPLDNLDRSKKYKLWLGVLSFEERTHVLNKLMDMGYGKSFIDGRNIIPITLYINYFNNHEINYMGCRKHDKDPQIQCGEDGKPTEENLKRNKEYYNKESVLIELPLEEFLK